MKASDYIALYLERKNIGTIFEMVGGMITHMLHSISEKTKINIVSCHHEQAAGFSAEGFARASGKTGVAFATSGPGATNLLTAIGSCYFDSVPVIFITGQVNTYEIKPNQSIRQLGFQETNIVEIAKSICKKAFFVESVNSLPGILENAFMIAHEGRKGPCLIDIPMNIQSEYIDDDFALEMLEKIEETSTQITDSSKVVNFCSSLFTSLHQSKRPLLLLGGGCAADNTSREGARKIVDLLQIPCILSLMGVDTVESNHPLRVGFIGSYGNRWANKALGSSDCLIVIGSRLDIRQTGSDVKSFAANKRIYQVDIDPYEIGLRVKPDVNLCCSVHSFACYLEDHLENNRQDRCMHAKEWLSSINNLKALYRPEKEYKAEINEVNPLVLIKKVSESMPPSTNYVSDVGQHQMWCAQNIFFKSNSRFLTSGGMGAMGFGLPAAIGASFGVNAPIVLISGDGSLQVNIQEFQTLVRQKKNIKIIVFNNQSHGMVRQFQESYFNSNYQSTLKGYSSPSFASVAGGYGIKSWELKSMNSPALIEWLNYKKGPCLLEVQLSKYSKVYPKLAFGRRFGDMEPETEPTEMEST